MYPLYENGASVFHMEKRENSAVFLLVRTNGFSGEYEYCIEPENLQAYLRSLEEFDLKEQGEFCFRDMDSDSFILFQKNQYGHLQVKGQLGSSFQNTYMIFEMKADQTLIQSVIQCLR